MFLGMIIGLGIGHGLYFLGLRIFALLLELSDKTSENSVFSLFYGLAASVGMMVIIVMPVIVYWVVKLITMLLRRL